MNHFRTASSDEVAQLQKDLDLLIVTATPIESMNVWQRMTPPQGRAALLRLQVGCDIFVVGRFGACSAVHVECDMGSGGVSGSGLTTAAAIAIWDPSMVVMIGIAFGLGRKQEMSEVLISSAIFPYEYARIGTHPGLLGRLLGSGPKIEIRGSDIPAGSGLKAKFRHARTSLGTIPYPVSELGRLISGDKLVDNADTKQFLIRNIAPWIGGEMEGAGLSAAAHRESVEWIVVKAICDWGDGTKNLCGDTQKEEDQRKAAENATDYAHRVFSIPFTSSSNAPKVRSLPTVSPQSGMDQASTYKALTAIFGEIRESFENTALLDSLWVLLAEIVDNVFRHGGAKGLSISVKANKIVLEDDGISFDPRNNAEGSIAIGRGGMGFHTFDSFQDSFGSDVTFTYGSSNGRNQLVCAFRRWNPGSKGIESRSLTSGDYENEIARTYKELELTYHDGSPYVFIPRETAMFSPIPRYIDNFLMRAGKTQKDVTFLVHDENTPLFSMLKRLGFKVKVLGDDFCF